MSFLLKKLKLIHFSKWSSRSSWKKRFDQKQIRYFLKHVSGNQMIAMLDEILTTSEKNSLCLKFKESLKEFGLVVNQLKSKEKHQFILPLKKSGLSRSEVRSLGFLVSNYMWKTCECEEQRNKGGRKQLEKDLVFEIEKHMKSLSNIASNRFLKKCQSNAYYCTVSLLEAYNSFKYKDKVSWGSFNKYLSEKFKKPFRFTDLCEYCEHNKFLKNELFKNVKQVGYEGNKDILEIKKFLDNSKLSLNMEKYFEMLDVIENIDYHLEIANRQRKVYNESKTNLPKDTLLIEIDWKQKVIIGMSPRQVGYEFYRQQQRAFIGFGVYYVEDDKVKTINIDLVSADVSQKGRDVVQAFKLVRKTEIFKLIDCKKYIVWTDAGTHFRCAEFLHYLFDELPCEGVQVDFNIFGEKHGKNSRDQHFSVVANFLRQESLVKKLCCTEDVVNAIHKHQNFTNSLKSEKIITKAFVFEKKIQPESFFKHVDNIKTYYNFFVDEKFNFKSRVISDSNLEVTVNFRNEKKKTDYGNAEIHTEVPIEIEELNINNLIQKNFQIKYNQRVKKQYIESSSANIQINIEKDKCDYCKNKCSSCLFQTNIQFEDLDNEFKNFTLKQLNQELKNHGHPKYKKIDGKNRNIEQAKNELKQHLLKFHLRI